MTLVYFIPVVIVCTPASTLGQTILETIDELQVTFGHNSLTLLLDAAALPSWTHLLHRALSESPENRTAPTHSFDKISLVTRRYLLVFAENRSLFPVHNYTLEGAIVEQASWFLENASGNAASGLSFLLLDVKDDNSLRPLVTTTRFGNGSDYVVVDVEDNLEEWRLKHVLDDDCDSCESGLANMLSVLVILGCSSLSAAFVFGVVAFGRYHLIKKRMSKGPYKVLLTATDFVFPQIADSRRVSHISS